MIWNTTMHDFPVFEVNHSHSLFGLPLTSHCHFVTSISGIHIPGFSLAPAETGKMWLREKWWMTPTQTMHWQTQGSWKKFTSKRCLIFDDPCKMVKTQPVTVYQWIVFHSTAQVSYGNLAASWWSIPPKPPYSGAVLRNPTKSDQYRPYEMISPKIFFLSSASKKNKPEKTKQKQQKHI